MGSDPGGSPAALLVGVTAAWTLLGLLTASQYYVGSRTLGQSVDWTSHLWEVPVWLVWAPITAGVVWLVRRFPLDEPRRRSRHLAFHLVAAGVVGVGYIAFWWIWTRAIIPWGEWVMASSDSLLADFALFFRARFSIAFAFYWAIVAATYAWLNDRRMRMQEQEAARAREDLANARLHVLRSQLRPHFLFNTLNTVAALVEEEPATARDVVGLLSALLRRSLDHEHALTIPLVEELDGVRDYLSIEGARFVDTLTWSVDADPDLATAAVPPFFLQPLVENAVRHGVGGRTGAGHVAVEARIEGGSRLRLVVRDDGPGLAGPRSDPLRRGIGLDNTRQRLEQLYGENHTFRIHSPPEGGVRVEIELPLTRVEGSAAASRRPNVSVHDPTPVARSFT